jgi:hypothetical protein
VDARKDRSTPNSRISSRAPMFTMIIRSERLSFGNKATPDYVRDPKHALRPLTKTQTLRPTDSTLVCNTQLIPIRRLLLWKRRHRWRSPANHMVAFDRMLRSIPINSRQRKSLWKYGRAAHRQLFAVARHMCLKSSSCRKGRE